MFSNILSKINPSNSNFLSELLKKNCEEDILDNFLQSNINIDHLDDNDDTPLIICLKNKRIQSALWLIKQNCDVTIQNKQNKSAVNIAVKQDYYTVVKALLSTNNIEINQTDTEGRTLLHEAVISGNLDIVNELMRYSANINIVDKHNRNILFDAISYGDDKLISKLLSTGELNINTIDSDGDTLLHKTEVLTNDNLAKKLLHYGADPTINDKDGQNFLFHTALRGEEGMELLDLAIEKGCNINGRIRNNNSILMEIMYAFANISDAEKERRKGLMQMAKKLIRNGIDVNAFNNQGETVLFDAVRKNDIEAVAFLLSDNVDVNKRNKKFETALSIAVIKGIKALDIILLLMDYGANITTKVKDLKTILEMLNDIILHTHGNHKMENQNLLSQIDIDNGKYLVVLSNILNKSNVKLDYKDFAGDPIYFKSLLYGNIDLFRLYVQYGVDLNKLNSSGQTLIHKYLIRIFELGFENESFEEVLLLLVNNKIDVNIPLPEDGKTVLSYIASQHNCNISLFKTLINSTRFHYTLQDNLGRTIIHSCVTGNNLEILKIINSLNPRVINIPDFYGLLPISYAALTYNPNLVLEMINLDAFIACDKRPTTYAIEKFYKLLPNLDKLTKNIHNLDDLRKMNIIVDQIKKDFSI